MRTSSLGLFRSFVAISLFFSFNVSTLAQKTEESVIFNFDGPNGAVPYGGLISDSSGNLYGTTSAGGTFGDGTVFELIPGGNNYTEMVLYSFTGGNDGGDPFSSLVRNSSGDLFGTTAIGGTYGAGTVFELSPNGTGYTETVLYSFMGGSDGSFPTAAVIFDAADKNLYGTTKHGGTGSCTDSNGAGCGIVFRLTVSGSETVLHRFTDHKDGALPIAPLVFDAKFSNLYGTTYQGGTGTCAGPATGCGVLFKLTLSGSETVLHLFTGKSAGALPEAPLVFDTNGLLYGTATAGGSTVCKGGCGVVFRLPSSGTTGFEVLHTFKQSDGANPTGGLAYYASKSDLYGTTFLGGVNNLGVVFELTTSGGSSYTKLHDFAGAPNDGANPFAGLLLLPSSQSVAPPTKGGCPPTCAGTSTDGGSSNDGTAYQVSP